MTATATWSDYKVADAVTKINDISAVRRKGTSAATAPMGRQHFASATNANHSQGAGVTVENELVPLTMLSMLETGITMASVVTNRLDYSSG